MISVRLLPAVDGDCFVIRAGETGPVILVDGGRASTAAAISEQLSIDGCTHVDLVVSSHVDQDHILGLIVFLQDRADVTIGDLWFNGYPQLQGEHESFGPVDGERMTAVIGDQGLPWNHAFGGGPVVEGCTTELKGTTITVLSPAPAALTRLEPHWRDTCQREGLLADNAAEVEQTEPPGWESFGAASAVIADAPYTPDGSLANASSIAILIEDGQTSVVMSADATAEQLIAALGRIRKDRPLVVDAAQIPHHGGAHNTSEPLIRALGCKTFLISGNGSSAHRPSGATLSRVIAASGHPHVHFNYATPAATWRAQLEAVGATVGGPDDDAADGFATIEIRPPVIGDSAAGLPPRAVP